MVQAPLRPTCCALEEGTLPQLLLSTQVYKWVPAFFDAVNVEHPRCGGVANPHSNIAIGVGLTQSLWKRERDGHYIPVYIGPIAFTLHVTVMTILQSRPPFNVTAAAPCVNIFKSLPCLIKSTNTMFVLIVMLWYYTSIIRPHIAIGQLYSNNIGVANNIIMKYLYSALQRTQRLLL